MSVDEGHSLRRTYGMFRSLGLRHLVVTGAAASGEQQDGGGGGVVKGIITRKDLMGFALEDR